MTPMTPKQRVMAVLRGEAADRLPFTVYASKVPQCEAERELRNRGMCLVHRIRSYTVEYPNVRVTEARYHDQRGRWVVRRQYETPAGTLSELNEPAGFTTWHHERVFKTPDDYRALRFMLEDAVVAPAYAEAAKVERDLGEDFAVRDGMPLEPLQALISGYMGTEGFAYEWMDNRDEVLKLYDALVKTNRETYELVAKGPLSFANYGGNVTPSVIGRPVFREYYMPHYAECAEIMHRHGKLLGVHFDAENITILNDIAETALDYIEAYDVGMNPSLAESLRRLPGKVLWLNWPSAWHLNPPEKVRSLTRDMLLEAEEPRRVIVGVTEDLPEERWRGNFAAIMDGIEDFEQEKRN